MNVNPQIFREYDIRGIAGEDLTPGVVELLGKAYGTYLKNHGGNDAVVGRDCRLSSEAFRDALIKGILSTGCNVVDVGVCPTPLLYYAIIELKQDGGMMVTGSHNPPDYNGFKLCVGSVTLHGEQIQEIRRICEDARFEEGSGLMTHREIIPVYQDWVLQNIRIERPVRVVIDAGNGTGGVVAAPLLRRMGCEVTELFCEMDGRFPNHFADPTVEANLQELIARVTQEQADVGIGYDGDADRIGVVDEKGDILWGDMLLILYSREILSRKPGATVISEVKCSQKLFDDIEKHGGRPIMWKTGHSLIKQKMKDEKAELAGEMSGHMFFADRFFGHDDAIYATCRLLEILSRTDRTLSQLLEDVPESYATPEIRVEFPEEKKFEIVRKAQEFFKKRYRTVDIDGARIILDDGWGLIRASNTQPVLVLRFEAQTPERLNEIRTMVEGVLKELAKQI
ncbi:MAG: phosphomannomutase/phosphoglucomutase [Deltaproteobacteria bacterium]|nr:phosphomannomutase/phosphoglucomutase [Deltaproteobacteria bacterium]MBW2309151.1 phosphomannomutase/phosphoglucomutase [Deltaproteobacteria bacterium]